MGSESLIELAAGPLLLTLAPSVGGSIAGFAHVGPDGKKTPIMRGVEGLPRTVLDAASFPLVPFSNRIRGGTFRFRNRNVTLAQNMAPDPSPLHGQGWLAPWDVVRSSETEAELVFEHSAGEWPWAYESRQRFTLDEGGFAAVLDCSNRADEAMPCGLGQHPYFHCTGDTRIDTQVDYAWTIDEQVLPVEKVPAEGRYDLRHRSVCGQDLDNGFGGWDGVARIDDPSLPFAVEMSSPDAQFFQLYSPSSGGIFVAEPVSHANAALNAPEEDWAELGMRVLEPGETMRLTMRIDVLPRQ
jgi:aldose 1-epimerase